jgi:hypothetical protein
MEAKVPQRQGVVVVPWQGPERRGVMVLRPQLQEVVLPPQWQGVVPRRQRAVAEPPKPFAYRKIPFARA